MFLLDFLEVYSIFLAESICVFNNIVNIHDFLLRLFLLLLLHYLLSRWDWSSFLYLAIILIIREGEKILILELLGFFLNFLLFSG